MLTFLLVASDCSWTCHGCFSIHWRPRCLSNVLRQIACQALDSRNKRKRRLGRSDDWSTQGCLRVHLLAASRCFFFDFLWLVNVKFSLYSFDYTSKLQQMFTNVSGSRDLMRQFSETSAGKNLPFDFAVMVHKFIYLSMLLCCCQYLFVLCLTLNAFFFQ